VKRWAALTVALYVAALLALTVPVTLLSFGQWWLPAGQGASFADAAAAYKEVGYWVWLAIMGGGAFLLLSPVGAISRKWTPRRHLVVPVITTSFFLASLFFSGAFALLCALFGEKAFELFAVSGELAWTEALHRLFRDVLLQAPMVIPASLDYLLGMITLMASFWLVWAMVFYFVAREDDPSTLMKRITRWLLRGSVLELLVAVPSHIIVRNRHECCAPMATFWGITTGLSVMLLCFGPGVLFLFSERFGRLRPK